MTRADLKKTILKITVTGYSRASLEHHQGRQAAHRPSHTSWRMLPLGVLSAVVWLMPVDLAPGDSDSDADAPLALEAASGLRVSPEP